jgi:hypothetical protein
MTVIEVSYPSLCRTLPIGTCGRRRRPLSAAGVDYNAEMPWGRDWRIRDAICERDVCSSLSDPRFAWEQSVMEAWNAARSRGIMTKLGG